MDRGVYLFNIMLLPLAIAFALIIGLTFLISYIQHRNEQITKNVAATDRKTIIHAAQVQAGNLDADLAKFLIDKTKTRSVQYRGERWVYGEFINRLLANFKTVTLMNHQASTFDMEQAPETFLEVFEITDMEGVKFWLKLDRELSQATFSDGQPRFISGFKHEDYVVDDSIETIRSVTTVIPLDKCDDACSTEYMNVMNIALKASLLGHVRREEPKVADELTTYHMVADHNKNLEFRAFKERPSIVSSTKLNASYEPVKLEFKGVPYEVPMNELLPILRQNLMEGQNICVFGATGTGKSGLIDQIVTNTELVIVRLNEEVIRLLSSAEAKNQLVAFCEHHPNVVFIYDEAQEAVSDHSTTLKLMALMDGDLKKIAETNGKIAVILSLNTRKEDVLPDLIRDGRGGIILDLGPLSKPKAMTLTGIFAQEGKTVDHQKINGILEVSGNATLAQTYGAILPEVVLSYAEKHLAKFRTDGEAPKPVEVPKVVVPEVAPKIVVPPPPQKKPVQVPHPHNNNGIKRKK